MEQISILSNYITLGQFLKIINVISSGGEAKFFLEEVDVYVNGELESRRGRKLYPNDKIVIDEDEYIICS